jgi:hypothetical protein
VAHVARIGKIKMLKGFWWGYQKVRDQWKDINADSKIILKWSVWI